MMSKFGRVANPSTILSKVLIRVEMLIALWANPHTICYPAIYGSNLGILEPWKVCKDLLQFYLREQIHLYAK
jgi:hypothetical protein